MQGKIIGNISNVYKIKTESKEYNAYARGKLKNNEITPLVGDNVEIQVTDEEKSEAIIEKVEQRKNEIKRPKISNIDQIIFVISTKLPKPDLLMLDKQLAYAEKLGINAIIIINKIDLQDSYIEIKEEYSKVGYKVIVTSAKENKGIEEVKEILKNKVSVFSGNSGVGKSSLINAIFDKDKTQEGEVSKKNKKGKNTTTDTKLYEIEENTYIADTPGFSSFEINEIESSELDKYFIEIEKELGNCEFVGCTHIKEEKCGVKQAVQDGKISQGRYERFCEIYNELKECIPDTFEMVVIASNAQWQEYGDDDVIYLPLPLKAYDLVDTVSDLLTDIHRRLKREREKPNKRSSADQGVINQAKSLLMEKNGLTEEEAHRYLQKRSMDNGTNMVETAYMVLQVF